MMVDFRQSYELATTRHKKVPWWIPLASLLGFCFCLILTGYVVLSLSFRAGNPAVPLVFKPEFSIKSPLWFSVTPRGDEIIVTTSDRKVFHWPQGIRTMKPVKNFIDWLKLTVEKESEFAVLAKKSDPANTTAIIAADQTLKFLHLRPILYALAEAGISQYGFEVVIPDDSTVKDNHISFSIKSNRPR